ncbi:MAG: DUF3617 family protein [Betaproteobacteria bacterium]|nr:DUF3617 family protein [Betaproteobacteria bacterium]
MKRKIYCLTSSAMMLCVLPLTVAAAELTPGQYEYTIKMNMPGVPNMPTQTVQRCLSAKEIAGNAAFQAPPTPNTDCQMKDLAQTGGRFSYKVSCTKPEKLDSTVKGTFTATSMTMDMTTLMANTPGPLTQTITARRIGDCKQ